MGSSLVAEKLAYSVHTAAALVEFSERSIWRLIREGKLEIYKISPGRVLIPRAALVAFLESRLDKSGVPLRAAPAHIRAKTAASALKAGG